MEVLLQMQRTNPFCKHISKHLLNGKAPQHETDIFTHIKGLLYKHTMDSGKQFLALIIPKSWKYTVLIEAHNKLGHQGNSHTYCLIKRQYYWKGMNKDIRKYIANCVLCQREKAKVQHYPLQMMEVPDRPFDKIAIDLVTECEMSTSGNKHILTIIDHLSGWPKAFPIPEKSADTIVYTFINEYLPVHNLKLFHKYMKPTLKKLCEKDPANCDKYLNQVLASYRITLNLTPAETPFFLVYGTDPNLHLHQLLEPMQHFLGDPDSGMLNMETHRLALAIAKKTLNENRFKTAQNTMA